VNEACSVEGLFLANRRPYGAPLTKTKLIWVSGAASARRFTPTPPKTKGAPMRRAAWKAYSFEPGALRLNVLRSPARGCAALHPWLHAGRPLGCKRQADHPLQPGWASDTRQGVKRFAQPLAWGKNGDGTPLRAQRHLPEPLLSARFQVTANAGFGLVLLGRSPRTNITASLVRMS